MIETTQVIIWWTGATVCLIALLLAIIWLCYMLSYAASRAAAHAMNITRFTTVAYWVKRMEEEGLTACRKEYRRMVAERRPKILRHYKEVDTKLQTIEQYENDNH